VRNRFQGEMTIVVNDQTTFTKQGQAITLKDLKVGDRIFAVGKEEKGQFVATQIRTGMMGQGRGSWQPH
jgi:Cu/Ag efflux protein CusF